MILRHQLNIFQRKHSKPLSPRPVEKIALSALAAKLKQIGGQTTSGMKGVFRVFQPETVLRWQQALVRKKWTFPHRHKGGRPHIEQQLDELILRLAQENPCW